MQQITRLINLQLATKTCKFITIYITRKMGHGQLHVQLR